jgi:hypothetical protein
LLFARELPASVVSRCWRTKVNSSTVEKTNNFSQRAIETPFKMPASYNSFADGRDGLFVAIPE